MEDETGPKKISNKDIIKGTHLGLFPARKFLEIPKGQYGVHVFDESVPNDEIFVKQHGRTLKVQLGKFRRPDHLALELQRATSDAVSVLQKYLGDNWPEVFNQLDVKYLCTSTESLPDSVPAINQHLRENLTSIQIEQLIDAMELGVIMDRINELVAQSLNCMAECIELGLIWQRLHLREYEATFIAGKKYRNWSRAGGKATKLLSEEQEVQIRAAFALAKKGEKEATARRLAKQFRVSKKTIQRANTPGPPSKH